MFKNNLGLLNSGTDSNSFEENSFLYSLQYLLLSEKRKQEEYELKGAMELFMSRIRGENGFYNNMPHSTGSDLDYLSHDQMRAYCIYSVLYNRKDHIFIWRQILHNFFTYDNLRGKFNLKRIVHPRDIIFIGYLNNNIICKLLMPIYFLIGTWTFFTETKKRPDLIDSIKYFVKNRKLPDYQYFKKTDGELLYWVESHANNYSLHKFFNTVFNEKIKERFSDWKGVFRTYYQHENHPINLICQTLDSKQIELK